MGRGSLIIETGSEASGLAATFTSAVAAAGGSLNERTQAAISEFIWTGHRDGWWDRMVEIYPFVGSNLAAASVKLKHAGVPLLTNAGMTEAEFSQELGIGPSSVTTKHLTTGFVPADEGLSNTNLFVAASLLSMDGSASGVGYSAGTQPASGEPLTVDVNGRVVGNLTVGGTYCGGGDILPLVLAANNDTSTYQSYTNGARTANLSSSLPGDGGLDTEFMIFRVKRSGTTYYSGGRLGMIAIGNKLTTAQALSCSRAVMAFERAVRQVWQGPLYGLIGDSITIGSGASNSSTAWAGLVRLGLGGVWMNHGLGGFTAYTAGNGATLSSGQSDFATLPATTTVVSIGTNDIAADGTTNGDGSAISNFQSYLGWALQSLTTGGKRVIYCGPSYRKTGITNETKCRAYSVAAAAAAAYAGVPFVDLDRAFRDRPTPDDFMQDNTHPNDSGHALTARFVLAALRGETIREPVLDFGNITAGSGESTALEVLNCVVGQSVHLEWIDGPPTGIIFTARVTGANEVTVRADNPTGADIDPTSFRVRIVVKN